MRRPALKTNFACLALCAGVFTLLAPKSVSGPQLSLAKWAGACKLNLRRTPPNPRPNDCWNATASWYGSQFNGQLTANGSVFNMYAATAAHPSLPLGSIVRISNPQTGRSLVVTINDRGPFVPGRGLDVSYEAARLLGFAEEGVCRVHIQLLSLPATTWFPARTKN